MTSPLSSRPHTVARYSFPDHFSSGELTELMARIQHAIVAGEYVLTDAVTAFESQFSTYLGVRHGVGCNSGTDALILALEALGVGTGDEVIVPANTFYATAAAVMWVGATPVMVDVDPATYLVRASDIAPAISPRTRAVIVVHLYGNVCAMDEITALCERHRLYLVEDCAQSHGARYRDRHTGSFGRIGCFSFHPSKNLPAAGDAGLCATDDDGLRQRIRMLRHLGQTSQNDHRCLGINSKLDALQALVLSERLRKLDRWNDARRRIAATYRELLGALPVRFQKPTDRGHHVYHLFQIEVDDRDGLLEHLLARGVEAAVRYPTPIHLQPPFAGLGHARGQFPVSESLSRNLLCLPLHPHMTEADIAYVVAAVTEFIAAHGARTGR